MFTEPSTVADERQPVSPAREFAHARAKYQVAACEPDDARREDAEAFVRRRYLRSHGAHISTFMPTLLLLTDAEGALAAVSGFRYAAEDAPFAAELGEIQRSWDQANYQSANAADRQSQLEALSVRSEELARKYPKSAEPLVWEGIVLSTYAGAKGGLGALSLAKKSRNCLLEATRIDPSALRGSAYTSLGALYYKVPGWPIGFGDREKASDYLHKALALNPDGMDPNYFIGELLYEQEDYARSLQHLQKALAAPPRADRPIADAGRRAEIQALVAKVQSKLER